MAARGDDFMRIQWRAGHAQLSTTQKYIDAARKVAGSFGTPFPPLPMSLVGGPEEPTKEPTKTKRRTTSPVNPPPSVATPMGIELEKALFRSMAMLLVFPR